MNPTGRVYSVNGDERFKASTPLAKEVWVVVLGRQIAGEGACATSGDSPGSLLAEVSKEFAMRYEMMFPDQIRKAIKENWPVVLPMGVLEYHAEHCTVGVDAIVVVKVAELVEKEMDIIILPPFYYGASSYAVAPPEGNGSVQIPAGTLHQFGLDLFRALLRIGFRNTHLFFWHQSENFTNGMPTDLAFKLAAREAIFEFLEKERGEGWWGKEEEQTYYADHAVGRDPFSWIVAHPMLLPEFGEDVPGGHAGKVEGSLMLALCPEAVDMKRYSGQQWYSKDAPEANLKYGKKVKEAMLASMRKALGAERR